jgi:hypothetical protein
MRTRCWWPILLGLLTATAIAGMTVDDVLRLERAGVSEDVILAKISSQRQGFDLTPDQLIQLKQNHVSERVIRAMLSLPAAPQPAVQRPEPRAPSAIAATPTAPAVTSVKWTTHTDSMGFSVNVPAGWELHADRKAGRIVIESAQGQKAIIWPVFLERQKLDDRSAGVLVQQLARRAGPELAWGSPEVFRGAARVQARGSSKGAAILRWSALPDGTAVYLYCVIAPSSLYNASADAFSGILGSFHVTPAAFGSMGRAGGAAAPPARAPLKWTRWTDPREGAFAASIPQGWSVSGGAIRHSTVDIRKNLVVLSPDQQIRITLGDANVGVYAAPSGMYGRAGLRPGMYTSLGDGSRLQIEPFLPATQFLRQYLRGPVLRDCSGIGIMGENQRPDLSAAAEKQVRGQGAPNVRVTAGGISFSCNWNGRPAHGNYAAATLFASSGMAAVWYADPLYGYIAVEGRQQEAEAISLHVYESTDINSDWKREEDMMAADAVREDNARAAELRAQAQKSIYESEQTTSDMIVKGYQQRSAVYDEIARKRENAILGTVDVIDPNTGQQYKVDNYGDYHWMNNQGVIAGTKTDSSPGVDWRQMITLP